ncbi:hypothetical protein KFK09_018992 [Dendrobium nobile]|uniref:Aminotransferase-like plant mobile domain-containing protein n=1 Tax=Dendrobium nobile TaxID=94219 RepID=A0A8T3B2P9_DENNO|nr:hypothetical protein KFK09_018992 [Dendrobium nobile]
MPKPNSGRDIQDNAFTAKKTQKKIAEGETHYRIRARARENRAEHRSAQVGARTLMGGEQLEFVHRHIVIERRFLRDTGCAARNSQILALFTAFLGDITYSANSLPYFHCAESNNAQGASSNAAGIGKEDFPEIGAASRILKKLEVLGELFSRENIGIRDWVTEERHIDISSIHRAIESFNKDEWGEHNPISGIMPHYSPKLSKKIWSSTNKSLSQYDGRGNKLGAAGYAELLYVTQNELDIYGDAKGVPNKERFDEESIRIHASIARAGDTPLEQKANANEIFRCCFHKWSEKEDDSLWAIHAELIVMRYHELKRHRNEGYSPPDLDCSSLDQEHVIFYRRWCPSHDKLIKNFYKDRMKEVTPDGQLREFFNLEDWQDLQYELSVKWHQTNDVAERKGQLGTILEAASHLLMVHDWPVNCPRFMEALRLVGLDCVSQMRYLRMDHHLLTALVERWSPQTNSFHLTVGEMTITLQDVAMILGVNIDGPALVGHTVVGAGRRWLSWPDCCDDLLGSHPLADVVYRDPFDHRITSRFRMGQAHAQTCIPLRWLRWTFWRDSYLDLNDMDFWRHVRAYILFILGCHLLPDTSGRPLLRVPFPVELDGLSVGFRWNEDRLRELPVGNLITYRDELDGLLESQVIWQPYTPDIQAQVAQICLSGADIWTARVPLISWKRVEWHLPDRVLRQFGLCPRTDIQPMDPSFKRVDGRGNLTWIGCCTTKHILQYGRYIHWYKSWATLYMLKAPVEAPTTAYPRAPSERLLRDFFLGTEQALQQHFNGNDDTPQQRDINTIAELCRGLRRQMYIEDQGYFEDRGEHEAPFSMTQEPPHQYSGYAGPSSYPDQGSSTDLFSSQVPTDLEAYLSPDFVPSSIHTDDIAGRST